MEAMQPSTEALPQLKDLWPVVLGRGGQQALERIVFEVQRAGQILLDLGARVRVELK